MVSLTATYLPQYLPWYPLLVYYRTMGFALNTKNLWSSTNLYRHQVFLQHLIILKLYGLLKYIFVVEHSPLKRMEWRQVASLFGGSLIWNGPRNITVIHRGPWGHLEDKNGNPVAFGTCYQNSTLWQKGWGLSGLVFQSLQDPSPTRHVHLWKLDLPYIETGGKSWDFNKA